MNTKLEEMLNGVYTLFVICHQWGDTGKGKFADFLAEWADLIGRGTGGPNAGHTICCGGQELATHVVPSGIHYDSEGKINIIGSGVVIDPRLLTQELAGLRERGLSYNHLRLSCNAFLTTPAQILFDRISEKAAGKGKIGSTGRGIAPTYTDFYGRYGLRVNDLANPDFFYQKLKRHLNHYANVLKAYDPELVKTLMQHEDLGTGDFYQPGNIFDLDAIRESYLQYGQELKPLIADTDDMIRRAVGRKRILGEGAQGDLLSVEFGTYPFVTSSDCTVNGLAKGLGLNVRDVDKVLGIIKGFYMTRVGGGPFPTELGGLQSEKWCNGGEATRTKEKTTYTDASINNPDEFLQGVAIRQAGAEYGVTTGRPRRTGWLDLPLLRYVLEDIPGNTPDIILTKLDVLNECQTIKVCVQYHYQGPDYYIGDYRLLQTGQVINKAIPDASILQYCQPIYSEFPGWLTSLEGCTQYSELPKELQTILTFVAQRTSAKPRIISVGPDRQETIFI